MALFHLHNPWVFTAGILGIYLLLLLYYYLMCHHAWISTKIVIFYKSHMFSSVLIYAAHAHTHTPSIFILMSSQLMYFWNNSSALCMFSIRLDHINELSSHAQIVLLFNLHDLPVYPFSNYVRTYVLYTTNAKTMINQN